MKNRLEKQEKKEILLIMPGVYGVKDINLPLPLLFIAKPLIEEGYKPTIFDCRVKDYKSQLKNLKNLICVGITSMSGEQVRYALEVSSYIKKWLPICPLSGVGPMALPCLNKL